MGGEFEGEGGVVFIEELEDVSLLGGPGAAPPRATDVAAAKPSAKRPKVSEEDPDSQPRKKKKKKKKTLSAPGKPLPAETPLPGEAGGGTSAEDLERSEWAKLGLCLPIVNELHNQGFVTPTRVQSEGIPAALVQGESLIGASETGSGKTLAFGLPMIEALLLARSGR